MGAGGISGGERSSQITPKAPTAQVGSLETKQRAFGVKVGSNKSEVKQKLPSAYSRLLDEIKEWKVSRSKDLEKVVILEKKKGKTQKMEEVLEQRAKGLSEATEHLTKILEDNPEDRKIIHERLQKLVTPAGRVTKGKMTKLGFLELAAFMTGKEVRDPRKMTQVELTESISHAIVFTQPRVCYSCEKVEDPGRPSTYKGLVCGMCGYSVCNVCNFSKEDYHKLGKTMKGLTIMCSCCKEWGQEGTSNMFKAGPNGSIQAEAKAFVYVKAFYERTGPFPFYKCWRAKQKGPQDVTIPLDVPEEDETGEWEPMDFDEDDNEESLYQELEYVHDTEKEKVDDETNGESFWYHFARGNKVNEEEVTKEQAVTLMEGELTMIKQRLGEIDMTVMESQLGSPVTSTQNTEKGLFQTEEEAMANREENPNITDLRIQFDLLQKHLDTVKQSGETKEINKCMNQLIKLRERYNTVTGGMTIDISPVKSPRRAAGDTGGIDNGEGGEEEITVIDNEVGGDGEVTVVGKSPVERSPEIPDIGSRVVMEDMALREEMRGMKKTLEIRGKEDAQFRSDIWKEIAALHKDNSDR